jgi:hypothetical protein
MTGFLSDPREKLRSKPMGENISYAEWIGDPRRWATREQVVAFANLQLREQIVPLITNAIQRYDAQRRANRWDRRLLRWLDALLSFRRQPSDKEKLAFLEVERRKMAALDDLTITRFPESEAPRDD